MISRRRMHQAFVDGGLGSDDIYYWWTPVWAVRSRIWRKAALKKQAVESLGEMAHSAIEDGQTTVLQQLAQALEEMKALEQCPEKTRRADVYYAIEELNESRPSFTVGTLMKKLNKELGTCITRGELERELVALGLDSSLPAAGNGKNKGH